MELAALKKLDDASYQLLFDVRRSVRYHDKRAYFLNMVSYFGVLLTCFGIAGSCVAGFSASRDGVILLFMYFLLALSGELVRVSTYKRGVLHTSFKFRFAWLERRIVTGPAQGDCWAEYHSERLSIEMYEPTPYKILDTLCHNELLRAEGFKRESKHYVKVGWWQSLTCQLWPWSDAFTHAC